MRLSKFDLEKKMSIEDMRSLKAGSGCSSKTAGSSCAGDSDTGESDTD